MGVPIIARGAGTGCPAAPRRTSGVILSLAKFNKILKIDPKQCTAVVQCGVRNVAISEAAAPYGLYYARPQQPNRCTIGAMCREFRRHTLLEIRLTCTMCCGSRLPGGGRPVEFGSEALDAAGLDLISVVVAARACWP